MNLVEAPAPLNNVTFRRILGVDVASLGRDEAVELLSQLVAGKTFTKIGFLNAHNANVASSDRKFAAALGNFLVLADGIGVDIASKFLYGAPFPDNLNGTDFVPALLRACDHPLTVGLLGARQANAERAAVRLATLAPRHRYVVVSDGYFTPEQEPGILAELSTLRPDILLVAMGVPRQEFWIEGHIGAEHCTLPIAVGALIDFLSGSVPRAPQWMRKLRLEWLFRLIIEPGRLWRRYVVGNPLFLTRVLLQKLRGAGRP